MVRIPAPPPAPRRSPKGPSPEAIKETAETASNGLRAEAGIATNLRLLQRLESVSATKTARAQGKKTITPGSPALLRGETAAREETARRSVGRAYTIALLQKVPGEPSNEHTLVDTLLSPETVMVPAQQYVLAALAASCRRAITHPKPNSRLAAQVEKAIYHGDLRELITEATAETLAVLLESRPEDNAKWVTRWWYVSGETEVSQSRNLIALPARLLRSFSGPQRARATKVVALADRFGDERTARRLPARLLRIGKDRYFGHILVGRKVPWVSGREKDLRAALAGGLLRPEVTGRAKGDLLPLAEAETPSQVVAALGYGGLLGFAKQTARKVALRLSSRYNFSYKETVPEESESRPPEEEVSARMSVPRLRVELDRWINEESRIKRLSNAHKVLTVSLALPSLSCTEVAVYVGVSVSSVKTIRSRYLVDCAESILQRIVV